MLNLNQRGRAVWQLTGLIILGSVVQIHSPPLIYTSALINHNRISIKNILILYVHYIWPQINLKDLIFSVPCGLFISKVNPYDNFVIEITSVYLCDMKYHSLFVVYNALFQLLLLDLLFLLIYTDSFKQNVSNTSYDFVCSTVLVFNDDVLYKLVDPT